MRKKTKELLIKIAVGFTAVAGSAFLLFGKKKDKKDKKEVKPTPTINKKDDTNLFI